MTQLYIEMLLAYRKRNVIDEIRLRAYHRRKYGSSESFKDQMLQEFDALKHGKPFARQDIGEGLSKFLSIPKASLLAWYFADRSDFQPTVNTITVHFYSYCNA